MVWRLFAGLVVVVAVGFGAFYAWAWHGEIKPIAPLPAAAIDPGIVRKGATLAAIGNCAVCHTRTGGKPYAGGFPVETPFGTIYGTNITPDPDTGIGTWSETAFRRALREGVDRQGRHLYPAFPYDHFTRISDSDIAALYAFLMTRQPVRQENRPLDVVFPLNIRLAAAGWKLLFLRKGEAAPDPAQSDAWNRGAYLVSGLGHCGACHTPRNALGAEKRDEPFAGGEGEGWHAPALNAASPAPVPWTEDQLFAFLRHGFAEQHGFAAGPMQPVVRNLKRVPDADVRAIATYVASIAGPRNEAQRREQTQSALAFAAARAAKVPPASAASTTGARPANDTGSNESAGMGHASGADIFAGACATCHHSGGELPISRPVALGVSTPVNAPDPTDLIHIVLDGIHPAPGERGPIMPGFSGALTDPQIVALLSYVRGQFSRQPDWSDVAGTLATVRRQRPPRTETP